MSIVCFSIYVKREERLSRKNRQIAALRPNILGVGDRLGAARDRKKQQSRLSSIRKESAKSGFRFVRRRGRSVPAAAKRHVNQKTSFVMKKPKGIAARSPMQPGRKNGWLITSEPLHLPMKEPVSSQETAKADVG